jgi:hypothetical protein
MTALIRTPLSVATLNAYISQIESGGLDKALPIYDAMNAMGYKYTGWAAGVARGDTVTGVAALDFLQDTAVFGFVGNACAAQEAQSLRRSLKLHRCYLRRLSLHPVQTPLKVA